ncbi:MAG: hypothetical protein H6577_22955 [Lewinellaceae bacterium]|nr:hypothetical protein [Saprospiraceae bacterium]MCB9340995.1 hypothetical protein [Lewinellaceae bacterium]
MILPNKHITVSQSLWGLAAFLLTFLDVPKTVDELWSKFEKINDSPKFPARQSFERVVLALDFLYLIDAIEITGDGKIKLCA